MKDEEKSFLEYTQKNNPLKAIKFLRELEFGLGLFAQNLRGVYFKEFKEKIPKEVTDQIVDLFRKKMMY